MIQHARGGRFTVVREGDDYLVTHGGDPRCVVRMSPVGDGSYNGTLDRWLDGPPACPDAMAVARMMREAGDALVEFLSR